MFETTNLFNGLCGKVQAGMCRLTMNGDIAEVMKNLTSGLTQAMQVNKQLDDIANSLPKPQTDDKEDKLRELTNKHLKRLVTYKDTLCHICGYSVDFDCLIAGYNNGYGSGCFLSPDDKIIANYNHYLYVPKDIVKE